MQLLRASVLYGSVVVLASGLAPNQKRSPSSMERREVLPFAIGAVLAPVVADAEDMVAPFTTPLPAQENRGVFKCFGEVDGKMVNTCKMEEEAEAKRNPTPSPRERQAIVDKEVNMDDINAAIVRSRAKRDNIVLRDTPEWLKSDRDKAAPVSAPEPVVPAPEPIVSEPIVSEPVAPAVEPEPMATLAPQQKQKSFLPRVFQDQRLLVD